MPNADAAVEGAHILNDAYAKVTRNYPDRFAAYGVLPMAHVGESVREVGRCLDDLGMRGIVLACSIQRERSPVEDEFARAWLPWARMSASRTFDGQSTSAG